MMAAATVRPYAPFSSQSGLRVPALEAAGIKLTEIKGERSQQNKWGSHMFWVGGQKRIHFCILDSETRKGLAVLEHST